MVVQKSIILTRSQCSSIRGTLGILTAEATPLRPGYITGKLASGWISSTSMVPAVGWNLQEGQARIDAKANGLCVLRQWCRRSDGTCRRQAGSRVCACRQVCVRWMPGRPCAVLQAAEERFQVEGAHEVNDMQTCRRRCQRA